MNTEYPTLFQCPETGEDLPEPGLFCKKCSHHGTIKKPLQRQLLTEEGVENTSDWKIEKPCIICVMANDGFWGWEEGHFGENEFRTPENGVLPGRCGVRDALNHHEVSVPTPNGVLNEQIILGFAQYALYNHLKWKDILEPLNTLGETRAAIVTYQSKYCATDNNYIDDEGETDEAWYWWKMIPKGIVLTDRLKEKLVSILVEYPDQQLEACVPKTCQPLNYREMTDDIWETFWDTYVEPSHVSHLFTATMEAVLTYDDELEWHIDRNSPEEGNPFIGVSSFFQSDIEWIRRYALSPRLCLSPMNFFVYREYPEGENVLTSPDNYMFRLIRIFDRDMFGTYLVDVINYQYRWDNFRRSDISRSTALENATEFAVDAVNIWVPPHPRIRRSEGVGDVYIGLLSTNVETSICHEDTSYWEDLQTISDDIIDSDYSNERSFREYLNMETEENEASIVTFIDYETDDAPPVNDYAMDGSVEYHDFEYEVEDDEDESAAREFIARQAVSVVEESHKLVEKLKELQTLVDEKIKDCIPEGVYLEMMNHMCEMYKITNRIPPQTI
jgi:hypothetical protein